MARTRRRKKRTHIADGEDPSKKGQPKSFVLRRGRHAAILKDLEGDIRRLMSPNTAAKLKESKRNVLKDFVQVAGPLGVTHFIMLTATHNAAYLRIAKSPRGPTITLRIHEYSLIRDILSAQQRPRAPQSMWLSPPLVVMNNFNAASKNDAEHLKLTTIMFQNMFPSINVATTKLSSCQRVLLLEYNPETSVISARHYSVSIQPSGVSKNLKTLVARRGLPDMGGLTDVSEFLSKSGAGSESEGEDADATRIDIDDGGNDNDVIGLKSTVNKKQSRIKLNEVGPRLDIEVVKVEEGLCGGRVLFHKYIKKSKYDAEKQQSEVELKEKEREKRRNEQEANVKRKEAEKKRRDQVQNDMMDAKNKKSLQKKGGKVDGKGQRRKREWWEEDEKRGGKNNKGKRDDDDDDDEEWYRKEVGEQPDEDFKPMNSSKKSGFGGPTNKKVRK